MLTNWKRAGVVLGAAATVALLSAGPAAAGTSWVYSGSCGSKCFVYKSGSNTFYTDKWLGLTTNKSSMAQ